MGVMGWLAALAVLYALLYRATHRQHAQEPYVAPEVWDAAVRPTCRCGALIGPGAHLMVKDPDGPWRHYCSPGCALDDDRWRDADVRGYFQP
jgi:hypothetical protein